MTAGFACRPYVLSKDSRILALSVLLLVAILVTDTLTPRGYTEWALYFLPIGVTLFQAHPAAPLVVGGVSTVLVLLGIWLSPPGAELQMVFINRSVGAFCQGIVTVVVWRVLTVRREIQRLLWLQQGETRVSQALLG